MGRKGYSDAGPAGRGCTDSGNGLPSVRAKDWQYRECVLGTRVTIYDFP